MPDIRSDFSAPTWVLPEAFDWVASPQPGVERVMLDRRGDEVAVATSLVRYAPDSRFPPHEHPGGEEFLVLEGEFGDEHRRYPAGIYVRNPPGSRHAPFSEPGCVLWVKLRQFHPDDLRPVVADTALAGPASGVATRVLHEFAGEAVRVSAAAAGATATLAAASWVQEVLVLDGTLRWRDRTLRPWAWLRLPAETGADLAVIDDARWLHKTRPAFALP
jgi:quercetin dioxygenase-like cupin family protein